MWFWWNVRHWTSGVNVHNEISIDLWHFNVPQLRILNIFSKRQILFKLFYLFQRLQWTDNCFFKIKFVFFLYLLCQHHERKTICLHNLKKICSTKVSNGLEILAKSLLPVFTLLLWQRQHTIVVDAVDYK
jgi:hypothetical protein